MKILIIRLSSIGDIILTAPVIKLMKQNIPGCRVDILVKDGYENVASVIKPDRVLKLKVNNLFFENIMSMNRIIKQINGEKYDIVIDLHGNFRTFFIMFFLKAPVKTVVNKDVLTRRLMVAFKWFFGQYKTVQEKYLKAAENALMRAGKYKIRKIHKTKLSVNKFKKIVIHAGAKWKLKRWPYFYDLIRLLSEIKGVKIFITGIKEEIEKNDELLYIKGSRILNLTGKITFDKLAAVIKGADLFIGNDTAAAHLAGFFGVPAIVVLGPTVPEFGFITSKDFYVIERKLACRPCNLHGGNKCPIGTFECMTGIKPDSVISEIGKLKG